MDTIKLQFTYACSFKGHLVVLIQFLLGCKYYQLSHVQVMSPTGVYSYNLDTVVLGQYMTTDISHIVELPSYINMNYHTRARIFLDMYGHYRLSNLFGANCVTFACFVAGIKTKTLLPARLYEQVISGHKSGYDHGCIITSPPQDSFN